MLTPSREVQCFLFKVHEVRQCWEPAHTCVSFLRDPSSQLKLDKDRTPLEVFWSWLMPRIHCSQAPIPQLSVVHKHLHAGGDILDRSL